MSEKEMKTLQLFYAAVLADSVVNYEENGILEKVTAKKSIEQEAAAPAQLQRLGISGLSDLFSVNSSLFGCARWNVAETGDTAEAVSESCLLCAIARQRGTASPCGIFCINPFKGFARALGYSLEARETLWDGSRCRFSMRKMTSEI